MPAGIGNFIAIFLFPFFMYYCQMGMYGAVISSMVSQYVFIQKIHSSKSQIMLLLSWWHFHSIRHIAAFSMICHLNKRVVLLPPKLRQLEFGGYLKSGKHVGHVNCIKFFFIDLSHKSLLALGEVLFVNLWIMLFIRWLLQFS